MDLALLERTLADRGEPAYRASQVWEWTARGVTGYEEMTNVPAPLRRALTDEVPFSTLEVIDEAAHVMHAFLAPGEELGVGALARNHLDQLDLVLFLSQFGIKPLPFSSAVGRDGERHCRLSDHHRLAGCSLRQRTVQV